MTPVSPVQTLTDYINLSDLAADTCPPNVESIRLTLLAFCLQLLLQPLPFSFVAWFAQEGKHVLLV